MSQSGSKVVTHSSTYWTKAKWLLCLDDPLGFYMQASHFVLLSSITWLRHSKSLFPGLSNVSLCSVTQSCLTLCKPLAGDLPDSLVHRILQARILEWVAMSYSRGSSQPRDRTHVSCVSCIAGGFFTHWATREAQSVSTSTLLLMLFYTGGVHSTVEEIRCSISS